MRLIGSAYAIRGLAFETFRRSVILLRLRAHDGYPPHVLCGAGA